MGRSERAAALTERRQAVAVIKNVRKVRLALASHPFDVNTFNRINGADRGIETLLGKEIFFEALSDADTLQLKHDVNAALNNAETTAFEQLRAATTKYFADVQKVIDHLDGLKITDKMITDLGFDNKAALESFNAIEIPAGGLDYERCMSTLEHFALIAESVDTTVPEIEQEIEEPEYTEEQHRHEGDPEPLPQETNVDVDPTEGNPEEQVELPEDPDQTPAPSGCDMSADLSWLKSQEAFVESANNFFLDTKFPTDVVGFTPEKAAKVLKNYSSTITAYKNALIKIKNTIASDTCIADHLLRGSTNFYQRFDRFVSLVERVDALREGLDKSCEALISASRAMLVAATRNPKLV